MHTKIEPLGATVVTVALEIDPSTTYKWIDAAQPSHPSLIDTGHVTGELFGFVNIPMAVWIDEDGMIVRNAEAATIVRSYLSEMDIPADIPERLRRTLEEAKAMPDDAVAYRAAILDWAANGSASPYALSPDEVIARSRPQGREQAEAAASFALGRHLRETLGPDAAVPWWRRAHELDPANWTYKRQAWSLVTTPEGADEPDLLQGPNDVYAGNWLDDVVALGGGQNLPVRPQL